ncbi:MAG: thermonuclease family protein [Phycisphaerae bacterium]|nr:thermonuclease family protein [Phycisphaerae bacterium]
MRIPVMSLLLFMFVLPAGCTPPAAGTNEITARTFHVLRVIDGDTFRIRYDGDVTSVRIWGIDAPEKNTPAGPAATEALRWLIDDHDVRLVFCATRKRDNFGRLLARVFVDDKEVGPELIRSGHASPYGSSKRKSK